VTADLAGRLRAPFSLTRRVPAVLQAESAECGFACLAMIGSYHGFEVDLNFLRAKFGTSARGITLGQLMQTASAIRLTPRALRLEPAGLARLSLPCILHWDLDHFVVLERAGADEIWIVDPAVGRRRLALAEASKHFTGVALELTPAADFAKAHETKTLTLGAFFRSVHNLPSMLLRLLLLSATLQLFALVMPVLTQVAIDNIVISGDLDLLTLLLIAFAGIVLLQVTIGTLRSLLVLYFGAHLQFGWGSRLFHHLLRLPLSFFERRHIADINSRFRSLASIQGLLTTSIVEAVIDGFMTITTIAVMAIYSPILASVTAAAVLLYGLGRLVLYRPMREGSQEALVHGARENGHFLESLRGILAIKSFSREQTRESSWQNQAADSIKASYKVALLGTAQQSANQLIFGFESVLVITLGTMLVVRGELSVGMLVAFLAYKSQFGARAVAFIDRLMEFRLADVHLDRLSDIALTEEEQGLATDGPAELGALDGRLSLKGISFKYSPADAPLLDKVNLEVRAGECIALVGPSGFGKTTLLKVMMGLLRPTEGQVLVDGRDVMSALPGYRRQIAGVMQEDSLLSGSLLDNIAFFDMTPDRERVEECARLAAIHDDIVKMPMGYLTLIGDMGAALSGGQKQRVLLARALYARPRILFLDEATSHLDLATERAIHGALARMSITRVVVAHRQETLAVVDRVVHLADIQGESGRSRRIDAPRSPLDLPVAAHGSGRTPTDAANGQPARPGIAEPINP
jgi:ATP-binding cassette, subfamily B, bacterial CvaB/MchF/RaxB